MNIVEGLQARRKARTGEGMPAAGAIDRAHAADHRETADLYRGEGYRLGRYRFAVCRGGLQWLDQRHRAGYAGAGAAWDMLSHHYAQNTPIRLQGSPMGSEALAMATPPGRLMRRGAA